MRWLGTDHWLEALKIQRKNSRSADPSSRAKRQSGRPAEGFS